MSWSSDRKGLFSRFLRPAVVWRKTSHSLVATHVSVYNMPLLSEKPLFIYISQSGETADTLKALRISKKLGYLGNLAICNMKGSSLVQESDNYLLTKAGIEIGVASTKSFTTQLTVLLMLVGKIISE